MRAGEDVPEEDLFDRSDLIDGTAGATASVTNGAAGAAAPSNTIEEDVDFRSL
jgi:hypothetical protein